MRYFIAYHLQGEAGELVNQLRVEIAERFGVKAALRIPPHLTLFYPFEMYGVRLAELSKVLAEFAAKQMAFKLEVPGFNYFGEAVWFVDVEQSEELFNLKKQLVDLMGDEMAIEEDQKGRKGVHFHITLAYQDVTPEKFKEIGEFLWDKLVPIDQVYVDAITLMEKKDDIWLPIRSFQLLAVAE